jgi:hypothetical protein
MASANVKSFGSLREAMSAVRAELTNARDFSVQVKGATLAIELDEAARLPAIETPIRPPIPPPMPFDWPDPKLSDPKVK